MLGPHQSHNLMCTSPPHPSHLGKMARKHSKKWLPLHHANALPNAPWRSHIAAKQCKPRPGRPKPTKASPCPICIANMPGCLSRHLAWRAIDGSLPGCRPPSGREPRPDLKLWCRVARRCLNSQNTLNSISVQLFRLE